MTVSRLEDLTQFYEILDLLERKIDGARRLADCDGRKSWPERGVYFFRERGQERSDSGCGLRIVRVGTHAITEESKAKLWSRLKAHKGSKRTGRGNHRSSVFRKHVGEAMIRCDRLEQEYLDWGKGRNAPKSVRVGEVSLEREISRHIGEMPFLWLEVEERKQRKYTEIHAIALLSNYDKPPLDESSVAWLGRCADNPKIRESGLWNSQLVEKEYESNFLGRLERAVEELPGGER